MSELPDTWAMTKLGELVTEVRNGISAKPSSDDGLPILRISAVRPLKLDTSDVRYLPLDFVDSPTYQLAPDDLLFTRYNGNRDLVGACARVGQISHALVYPDKLIRVRLDRTVALPRYIEKAANSHTARTYLDQKLKTSAGQIGVSGADIKGMPLALPPLPEQHRIADQLDTLLARVNACNDHLDAIPGILKRFRQAVLNACVAPDLLEATPGASFRVVRLLEVLVGPLRNGKSVRDGTGMPVLRLTSLKSSGIDLKETKAGDWSNVSDIKRFLIQDGDYLVSRGNGSKELVGRGGLVSKCSDEIAFPDTMIRVRPDPAELLPDYL